MKSGHVMNKAIKAEMANETSSSGNSTNNEMTEAQKNKQIVSATLKFIVKDLAFSLYLFLYHYLIVFYSRKMLVMITTLFYLLSFCITKVTFSHWDINSYTHRFLSMQCTIRLILIVDSNRSISLNQDSK